MSMTVASASMTLSRRGLEQGRICKLEFAHAQ
jgi:hypothetical protein